MEGNTDKTKSWATYFEDQKKIWHDPSISPYVKCFIRLLELHRGDSRGWSLSIRLVSKYLGIAPNTARKVISQAIKAGLVESNTTAPRRRRKLRLSASLRAPVDRGSHSSESFYHQMIQPVSRDDADSESPDESVNIQGKYINANTEKSQVKPNEKIEKSIPYKERIPQEKPVPVGSIESEGWRKLREKAKELGWKEKS